jgi:Domain of unknown function (DUF5667)
VLAVNTSVFHRRRTERFAQLLDEAGGARRHHVRSRTDQNLSDLAEIGHRLARIDIGVRAGPEFRDGLRAMLMATIEREGIGATAVSTEETAPLGVARHRSAGAALSGSRTSWVPIRSRRARGAVVIGLAVGTLAVSGMSAASGDAVPGDALYGMKRSAERAQLALAGSQVSRGQLYLDFAKTRMNEAAALHGDAPGLAGVLDDMDNETRRGVKLLTTAAVDRRDPAALDVINAFTGDQRRTMLGMLGAFTGNARGRTLTSLGLLDDVQRRVEGLRGGLRCGDVASDASDELGPLPQQCSAQGPVKSTTRSGGDSGTARAGSTAGGADTEADATAPATADRPTDRAPSGQSSQPAPQPKLSTSPSTPEDSRHGGENIIDKIGHLLGGSFN